MQRIIIIHTLDQAIDALEVAQALNLAIILQSAPNAIFYAGGLYLFNLFEKAKRTFSNVAPVFILDCANAEAETMQALRIGHRHLRLDSRSNTWEKLVDIAAQYGATIHTEPYEALDLAQVEDTKSACKTWLQTGRRDYESRTKTQGG